MVVDGGHNCLDMICLEIFVLQRVARVIFLLAKVWLALFWSWNVLNGVNYRNSWNAFNAANYSLCWSGTSQMLQVTSLL